MFQLNANYQDWIVQAMVLHTSLLTILGTNLLSIVQPKWSSIVQFTSSILWYSASTLDLQ